MGIKMDIETGIITIDEKYQIKPSMSLEEIRNSNLSELMSEESKQKLINDPDYPMFVKSIVDEDEISIELDIIEERLAAIYIKVNPAEMAECYYTDDDINFNHIVERTSMFMDELFGECENNRYRFKWGFATFNSGARTYSSYIEILYYPPEFMNNVRI